MIEGNFTASQTILTLEAPLLVWLLLWNFIENRTGNQWKQGFSNQQTAGPPAHSKSINEAFFFNPSILFIRKGSQTNKHQPPPPPPSKNINVAFFF